MTRARLSPATSGTRSRQSRRGPSLAGSIVILLVALGLAPFAAPAPALAGPGPLPPSPQAPGDEVMVVQWCDTAADMQAVADAHAAAGKPAASALYDQLVAANKCHWLPTPMPTTGRLVRQQGFAFVTIAVPFIEKEERAVIEVWSATVEGIQGRAIYITLAHWAPDQET